MIHPNINSFFFFVLTFDLRVSCPRSETKHRRTMATTANEVELTTTQATPVGTTPAATKTNLISLSFGNDLDDNFNPNTFATSNSIATTRYTLLSFLPKSLFEQFRRIANVYFLAQVSHHLTSNNSLVVYISSLLFLSFCLTS